MLANRSTFFFCLFVWFAHSDLNWYNNRATSPPPSLSPFKKNKKGKEKSELKKIATIALIPPTV